jgi:multiple sugar transport system permease protein
MSFERGIISTADRQRGLVRYGLPAIQVLIFLGVLVAGVGPLLWLLKSGVSTSQDILKGPMQLWPSGIQPQNIPDAWNRVQIGAYLGNTAFIAIGSMISTLFVCTTGAFVLSILRPKWGPIITGAVLATLFLPGVISLVPLYMTVLKMPLLGISLQNTFWAVWLPSAAGAFNVLVMKRYFDSIPRELIEAARIDGAGEFHIFRRIAFRLLGPGFVTVLLFTFVATWNNYFLPLVMLSEPKWYPLTVGLAQWNDQANASGGSTSAFNLVITGALVSVVPLIIAFVFLQRFWQSGLGTGGVKG